MAEAASEPVGRFPSNKRRRIGLACKTCRVCKSRYAMPTSAKKDRFASLLLPSLVFVADAMISARPARRACHCGSIAYTNSEYRPPTSLYARVML